MNKTSIIFALFSSIFLSVVGSATSVSAQTSCQDSVDSVIRNIRNRGARINYSIIRNNPPLDNRVRRDEIAFTFELSSGKSSYIAENILHSVGLMTIYANQIFSRCNGTGYINFGIDRTDWIEEFIMTDNNILGFYKCSNNRNELNRNISKIEFRYDYGSYCAYIITDF